MSARSRAAALVCATLLGPAVAQAQPASTADGSGLPGRFELGAGVLWIGAASIAANDATETGADGTRFRLFATDSSLEGAPGGEARIGIRLTRLLRLEGSASSAKPELRVRIGSDVEGIPDVTVVETVTQWTIEGALVVDLARWSLGSRSVPFVSAGGGYLRQRHEGGTLIDTGSLYHAGGGLNIALWRRDRGRLKGLGLRADVRAVIRAGGVAFDDGARLAPAARASLFVRF